MIAEVMEELDLREDTVHVAGIGCYGALDGLLNVDRVNALHGRAPSVATGVKRMLPDRFVITIQGDGDLISEGIAEAVHCAARGEKFTVICLNNTVNGETGGHMTAATIVGQKTKSTLQGRDAEIHGHPVKMAELLAQLDGTAYSARGSVHSPVAINRTKKMLRRAFEAQIEGRGFSYIEIMTMCPNGVVHGDVGGPQVHGGHPHQVLHPRRVQDAGARRSVAAPRTSAMLMDGLTVLDLTQGPPAPSARNNSLSSGPTLSRSSRLRATRPARAGPFAGDRPHPETSALFLYLNAGKRSVVLDIHDEQGRAALRRLAERAGALVEERRGRACSMAWGSPTNRSPRRTRASSCCR